MGTPEFAVASLDALVNAGCTVVGVITAPDKPAGRGLKLQESAVKKIRSRKSIKNSTARKIKELTIFRRVKITKSRRAGSCRF